MNQNLLRLIDLVKLQRGTMLNISTLHSHK